MTGDAAKLRHHRELGACLLKDLIQATPETAVGLIERVNAWERDLIPLVELFGVGAAARFKPLITLLPHEQLSVARCAPLDEETTKARREHAVRMSRLDELFKQFPPVLPKGKGGNRRTINDGPIVEKACAIRKSSGTENKMSAAREAMKRHPELVQGLGTVESKAKRIARQM